MTTSFHILSDIRGFLRVSADLSHNILQFVKQIDEITLRNIFLVITMLLIKAITWDMNLFSLMITIPTSNWAQCLFEVKWWPNRSWVTKDWRQAVMNAIICTLHKYFMVYESRRMGRACSTHLVKCIQQIREKVRKIHCYICVCVEIGSSKFGFNLTDWGWSPMSIPVNINASKKTPFRGFNRILRKCRF